MKKTNS